jgi:acyl-CoA thioesterase
LGGWARFDPVRLGLWREPRKTPSDPDGRAKGAALKSTERSGNPVAPSCQQPVAARPAGGRRRVSGRFDGFDPCHPVVNPCPAAIRWLSSSAWNLKLPDSTDPQRMAQNVRDAMLERDTVLRTLGIAVTAVGPGEATATMTVRPDMLNGFAICHGGLIATLADTAFAYACNSHGELTVASGFSIDIVAPSHAGDVLTAVAREVQRSGRTGLCDIVVDNQNGRRVALFRGRSHTLKGKPVPGLAG